MTEEIAQTCPTCMGEKVIPGNCVCNSEWRGNQAGDDWDDCRCEKEQQCPACGGTGSVESE